MDTTGSTLPLIGITLGDPTGIGPEIIVKALARTDVYGLCRPVVIGDAAILERELQHAASPLQINIIDDIKNSEYSSGILNLCAISRLDPRCVRYGHPDEDTGNAMGRYITHAVSLALQREIDALVTAPINKKSLQKAGYPYPGHTEMLAHLTRSDDVVMMLAGEKLRVSLVTIHCALSLVPKLLTVDTILKTILITDASLKNYFSLSSPRIAVAALNPHAGEEGIFGVEERVVIVPAIQQAQLKGVDVSGPFPPDTLFYHAARGKFDAVVCMYHDQGLIPLKLLHFADAVNITLGLPIIRTSVDHGTAYDIAGRGIADPTSLINAITVAAQMAKARQ
ncbi:MAG: 4-hydroxythreonine-4-phosphate dehydrogenase PdxA [Proteobacteria bacterium]|nr:4-hydroxythreonine-4-phosphate dehydrogenase PdxA [Pseudomonadota bacterium]